MKEVRQAAMYIADIIQDFANGVRKLLGDTLDSIILYGSYARGDYSEYSDMGWIFLRWWQIGTILITGWIICRIIET